MGIPNSTWTEITSTSLADYREELADNVLKNNVFLARLQEKGNTDEADGGYTLLENLLYNSNSTFAWYNGYMQLNVAASNVITSAQFDWRQANCNVTISGLEQAQNSGREQKISLIKSRILGAEKTMQNNIAAALFFSNTENSGLSIGGLQYLVQDLPTGASTVGGIDQSANAFWQNQFYSFSGHSATASPSTIQHAMNLVWHQCLRGLDKPDIVTGGLTYFLFYYESLTANQRFTNVESGAGGTGNSGFPGGVKYNTADMYYDPNELTGTRMYFLNTDYFHYRPWRERNFVTDPEKAAVNQDAIVIPVYWMGNLTCSNRSLQGLVCT
jgi:hypothetical protein